MKSIRPAYLMLLAAMLLAGCATPPQRLATAEAVVTSAQDTWTSLLTNRVVKDRVTIRAGTAAINYASDAVGKAKKEYTASTQPGANAADAVAWLKQAENAAEAVIQFIAQVQADRKAGAK